MDLPPSITKHSITYYDEVIDSWHTQAHDLQGSDVLMNELTKADAVLADKAYDADVRMRDKLKDKGCIAVILPKKNRVNPANYDKDLYKARHLIENFFAKLKQYRAIVKPIGLGDKEHNNCKLSFPRRRESRYLLSQV